MKITPNINDALLVEATALAEQQGITLTQLVEQGLRMRLQSEQLSAPKVKQISPVFAPTLKPSISELFGIAPDYDLKAT